MIKGLSASPRPALVFLGLLLLISACAPQQAAGGDQTTPTVGSEPGPQTTLSAQENGGQQGPITLRLWLPPAFSTFSGNTSATLLQERLDLFHEQNPNIQIEIRLKDVEGAGSLIESWSNAAEAAPLALPDLVLLDNDQFDLAQGSGLLQPLSEAEGANLGADWYPFGKQMVEAEGQRFGWPLAGDAMILMHRFSAIEEPPFRWEQVLAEPLVLAFSAGNPEADFALLQYASLVEPAAGGSAFDEIQTPSMLSLLNFLSEGRSSGIFPFWLTQLETEAQSWQAFVGGQSPMVVTWSNRFFLSSDENQGAGAVPSADGAVHSFVRSWAWAVASQDARRRELAISLAEFLSDAEFMAQWSAAAGYLPARESALVAWAPSTKQALGLQIAPFAQEIPALDVRSQIGPLLSEALINLLKDELTAEEASQRIQEGLASP